MYIVDLANLGKLRSFLRGNANGDSRIDMSDAITTLGFLFLDEPQRINCQDASDTDDNGVIDITDAIYLLNHLFIGGSPPKSPFLACGPPIQRQTR